MTLFVSALVVAAVFLSVPGLAKALPETILPLISENGDEVLAAMAEKTPEIPVVTGDSLSALYGTDYIDEPEIPVVEDPEGAIQVFSGNFSWYEADQTPVLNLINRTKFNVDIGSYAERDFPIDNPSDTSKKPLVLIVHTHGTESYLADRTNYYFAEETFRTHEAERSVVAVGAVLAEKLSAAGINTVHDTTMYDIDDFNKAYTYSKKAVAEWLEKYPSIKYVIDLHRDAIFDSDGIGQKPIAQIDGTDAAQVMFVIGTNEGGAAHPEWRENLTVAVDVQQRMNDLYPTLARPLCLRSASFNQQLCAGSLLLEVGSCANTITEAKNAVLLFADAYIEMIKSH